MGSRAKNSNNSQQASTATPTGVAGPMTTAPMTAAMRKNPVSIAPIPNLVPGVSDRGPTLPGMAAGFDSHGMPIQQAQPRNTLAQMLSGNRRFSGGSSSDRGGYTTSGSGWGGNSSANSGYGMGGRRW